MTRIPAYTFDSLPGHLSDDLINVMPYSIPLHEAFEIMAIGVREQEERRKLDVTARIVGATLDLWTWPLRVQI